MQKELNGYLIVEVPEGAICEVVNFEGIKAWIRWYLADFSNNGNIDIPPGSYEIVEIESVVHDIIPDKVKEYGKVWLYNDYETGKALFTALESFESWKRKEGFKNVVILKKVNL